MAKTPLTPQINWPTLANSRADQKRSEEDPVFTITFLKVTAAVKLSALVPSSGGGDRFACPLTIAEHVVYFPFIIRNQFMIMLQAGASAVLWNSRKQLSMLV